MRFIKLSFLWQNQGEEDAHVVAFRMPETREEEKKEPASKSRFLPLRYPDSNQNRQNQNL